MVIAGVIGRKGLKQTAELIYSFFTSRGQTVSIINSKKIGKTDIHNIKKYIEELKKNDIDLLIFKINPEHTDIDTIKYIHFDIIVCEDKMDWYSLFPRLDKRGIVIVNIDDDNITGSLQSIKEYIVTYGFNQEASITASSVGDMTFEDTFICCLRKTISTWNGEQIEPQEYKLKIKADRTDKHKVLAAASLAIVSGVDLNVSFYQNTTN